MTRRVAMILQKNIRLALFERGWSQARAARELGMHPGALNERLKGDRSFRVSELLQLAGVLDIPLYELLRGAENSAEYIEFNVKGKELRQAEQVNDE